ncbi:MAG: hypothetical protein ACP5NF_07215 [Thermoanaerobaculum sp.]
MRRKVLGVLALVVTVGLLGMAVQASAQGTAAKPAKPAHHGQEFKGTVSALDEQAKVFKAKDAAGKEVEFSYTSATKLHGTLKVGEPVTVRYMVKEGKNVATSVVVGAAPAKK